MACIKRNSAGAFKKNTNGLIEFKIKNFSSFVEKDDNIAWSTPAEIQGIRWSIQARIENVYGDKQLGVAVFLADEGINCRACVTLRLLDMNMYNAEHHERELPNHIFSNNDGWGEAAFMRIEKLMNSAHGWYDSITDSIYLEADVDADRPLTTAEQQRTGVMLVNGRQKFSVDKFHLSHHSKYFKNRFSCKDNWHDDSPLKVRFDENISSMDDFKLMINYCTYPEHLPLDDNCIEGMLNLACKFQVDIVEGLCVQYLIDESWKSAIFKYRLADRYDLGALKKIAWKELVKDRQDMSAIKLVEYSKELCRMTEKARWNFIKEFEERAYEQQSPAAKRARMASTSSDDDVNEIGLTP